MTYLNFRQSGFGRLKALVIAGLAAAAVAVLFLYTNTAADGPESASASASQNGEICGGAAGISCDDGEYCHFETGQCRIPDAQGVCRQRPLICTEQYEPVCGCNDKTYGNVCLAAAEGVSVLHDGECGDS